MTSLRRRLLAAVLAGSTLAGAATVGGAPMASAQADEPAERSDRVQDRSERFAQRVDERRARLEARLAEAVADGRLTQDEADERLERLDARLAERQATREERQADREARRAERRESRDARAEALAAVVGTSVDELAQALRDGASLADIAAANGVSADAVIDHLVERATERLGAAVEAGRIDQDRAEEKRDAITERITSRVNGERADRGERSGREGRLRGNDDAGD